LSALEQAAREFLSLERQHPLRSAGPSKWTDPFQSANWIPDRQLGLSFFWRAELLGPAARAAAPDMAVPQFAVTRALKPLLKLG
jgi:hypothetical protein